jgi:hypothetical protein
MDIIFDIDGTLMNIDHRRHFVEGGKKDWGSFERQIKNDVPYSDISQLLVSLFESNNHRFIFCSGRREKNRKITVEQITAILSQAINYLPSSLDIVLVMRDDDDRRPDYIVKLDILEQLRAEGYNPELVFDDRTSVVEMWRAQGIRCLQVNA